MSFLTGVASIVKESFQHPLRDSFLVETAKGYVAIQPGANLSGLTFENYDFRDLDFRAADLHDTTFRNCDLTGADLTGANRTNTRFENCTGLLAEYAA